MSNSARLIRLCTWSALCAVLTAAPMTAQHTIRGRVIDADTGEALENVNVFLDRTTLGASTSSEGSFRIEDVTPGSYRLVASMVGYETRASPIEISPARAVHRKDFTLKPVVIPADELVVEAERPRDWLRNLERFERAFLGSSAYAKDAEILNPYVIDFETEDGVLTAKAGAPIEVVNRALGYRLTILLTDFVDMGRYVSMAGPVFFREMEAASPVDATAWRERRREAYRGSLMHLLRSLVSGTTREEGFFVAHVTERQAYGYGQRRFLDLGMIPFLEQRDQPYLYRLFLTNDLHVEFGRERSRLHPNQDSATLHEDGYLYASSSARPPLSASGDLSRRRVADMLPLDYRIDRPPGGAGP